MIVHELKTIFIHIPKTAGVSIIHALMSSVLDYETEGLIKNLPNPLKQQFSLKGLQKHKMAHEYVPSDVSKASWNNYYKFVFVRNPWDKVVSEYCWRMSLNPRDHPFTNFEQFLRTCKERPKRDTYWTHAQPQIDFISNNNNVIVDDVFKFEEFSSGISTIEDRLNISINVKHHNASQHKHYQDYYNEKTRQQVYKLYKQDIKTFDYEF